MKIAGHVATVVLGLAMALGQAQVKGTQHKNPPPKPPGIVFGKARQPAYPIFLLEFSSVQSDLHVTSPVASKIAKVRTDAIKRHLQLIAPSAAHPNSTKELSPQEAQAEADKLEAAVTALLTPTQLNRLREIGYQFSGAFAMMNPLVAQKLGVTSDEREKLQRAIQIRNQEYNKSVSAVMGDTHISGSNPQAANARVAAARITMFTSVGNDAAKILTPAQVKLWQRMMGKPFPVRNLFFQNSGKAKS